jgi:hypothetical protein
VKLDLNAKRAARAAQRGEGLTLILGEEEFDLVDELPIEIGELAADNKIPEALRMMLRDPADWDRLRSQKPSFNDVLDVVSFYGEALGESVRSHGSSTTTTPPSKPTGSGSTDETSEQTSTVRTVSTLGDSPH